MLRALLVAAALCAAATGDDVRLIPGQRLEQVEHATFQVESAGIYTLISSKGALVFDKRRSDEGWVIIELKPGQYSVDLPDGAGDITALPGEVQRAKPTTYLNRVVAAINESDFPAARVWLLACRARPISPMNDALARMFQGDLLRRDGKLAEARELLIGSQEMVDSGQPELSAYAADSLGQLALAQEDWDLAQHCFEKVQGLATDAGSKAFATSRLATVAAGRHQVDSARSLHEQALAMLTDDSAPTYVCLVNSEAGKFFKERAEFVRATDLLERAATSAPRWDQKLAALGLISQLEMARGHYGAALRQLDAVNALAQEHSPSPYDQQVLRTRAELAFNLGEFGMAEDDLGQLLESGVDDESRAGILADLALLAFMQDDPAAMRRYDEALTLASEPTRSRWRALNGKAAALIDDDHAAEAEPLAREALALATKLDDAHLRTASLITVSGVSARLGRGSEARTVADEAVARVEEQDARDLLLPALHNVARAALLQGDEKSVNDLLDRAWKESMSGEASALPSLEAAQVRSRLSELADWSEVAADLTARHASEGSAACVSGFRRVEQWKARTLLSDIQGHPELPAQLEAAVSAMLGGRALIEYVAGEKHLYAFVVTGETVRFVDLGPRRPIEELVRSFVGGLRDEQHLAAPADVVRDGRRLYASLLEPLAVKQDQLVIVPCGELSRLPFEALVISGPESADCFDDVEFVLDRKDVAYGPSAAALVALGQRASTPRVEGQGMSLLLGDPTYSSEQADPNLLAARSKSGARWERLPHTRDELTRVARLLLTLRNDQGAKDDLFRLASLEDQRDVSLSTPAFELRLGSEASAAALADLAPRARLIHVAAHAQVDHWDARRTGLVLAWNEGGQGLFSLADIAALQLHADLVLLSACETADGPLLNDEGVQSMADAFLAAGARGVVATLWPVSDPQSQTLMERFASAYLADGESPDHALRMAKRELRRGQGLRGASVGSVPPDPRRGHPHSWAPFLFSGAAAPRAP